jgi:RNA polymerase sigma factor (TIGR02999 family)
MMPEPPSTEEVDPNADNTPTTVERPTQSDKRRWKELEHIDNLAYEELRRLAASVRHSFPNSPLSPSTIVQEVWMKLVKSSNPEPQSELEFKCRAAKAMRNILVDAARRRGAKKRGGDISFALFDDSRSAPCHREVVALDDALKDLALAEPRQASIVELRFFGGLDVAETANLLKVSKSAIERDWRAAKAWLKVQIRREP